ncbi:AmmeMemoRadiSam system protein B [Cryptococcus amylolentus CBS 6039]|uniref:AmmeMemoRadiSam system protein B n=2 Tax=Cryptococcus amylolentus TaxID=104669 RepID=A0A1E3HPY0_9TREE|nr:AmmeMemoRadiSam system protein B [Cryptococcus amylolentus CBS 6039]ODN78410.1 AmmeMemoRadiSam system protein B [Cryptococcus amylolentus CBS 6039]ODO07000.1 AmmeMemoRadiSam system protein B [Cryptococcus amylolentus CBS 6273]
MSGIREATHAGSWYTASSTGLSQQLNQNLSAVHPLPELAYDPPVQDAKAIIAPHAGFSYSGPAAAWAYKSIPVDKITRVILLGPSHHAYLPGVALSKFEAYETPLGDIPLDLKAIHDLRKTGIFSDMKSSVDEDEHSLEMHLPYIRLIFQDRDISLVPILVGHPSASTSRNLSAALEPYWSDPSTFFVISSDFCHWGSRFSCTPYYPDPPAIADPVPPTSASGRPLAQSGKVDLVKKFSSATANPDVPIWRSTEYMDHEGMAILRNPAKQGAVDEWHDYLERTKNTICGRSPITVLLNLVQHVYADRAGKPEFTFVRYEQSSRCVTGKDSSVSYVSGILRVPS